jgi:dTDP-glucose pyrophosphorylase/CBS domain-containing protein
MSLEIINKYSISPTHTIMQALQKMDVIGCKLLLVIKEGTILQSMISIGDIQRAILKSIPLTDPIELILRKNVKVCSIKESKEEIKETMFKFRAELMPVTNENNEVVNLYFWNDFFQHSHLHQTFEEPVDVVIMAGGQGTRLKPLTNIIPKPLIPIGDKAIMEVIIDQFVNLGANNFYITVNYKHEMIDTYFKSINDKKYDLEYLLEEKPLGTGGSLYLLKEKLNKTVFVTNCDIVINEDYNEIFKYHKKSKNDITIVSAIKNIKIPYGTIEAGQNGELIQFKEKPDLVYFINTGMYILEPHIIQSIENNVHIHITEIIENTQKSGGKVGVFPISENSWYDIGEWAEYQKIIDKYK